MNDSFVFQQDSTFTHHVCTTIQLLQHEILNFLSWAIAPTAQSWNPLITRHKGVVQQRKYESRVKINKELETVNIAEPLQNRQHAQNP